MANLDIDPFKRVVNVDLVNNTYKQSTNMCSGSAMHRKLQFVRIERGGSVPGIFTVTYWDSYQLQYVRITAVNKDAYGNPIPSYGGPVTWNANMIKKYTGDQIVDYDEQKAAQAAMVMVDPNHDTDVAWKSAIRFYGVRDALIGAVPFFGKSPY